MYFFEEFQCIVDICEHFCSCLYNGYRGALLCRPDDENLLGGLVGVLNSFSTPLDLTHAEKQSKDQRLLFITSRFFLASGTILKNPSSFSQAYSSQYAQFATAFSLPHFRISQTVQ